MANIDDSPWAALTDVGFPAILPDFALKFLIEWCLSGCGSNQGGSPRKETHLEDRSAIQEAVEHSKLTRDKAT